MSFLVCRGGGVGVVLKGSLGGCGLDAYVRGVALVRT